MKTVPAHTPAASVDPDEVEYYHRLADMWWDTAGPFWPLHRLNRLRQGYITKQLCQHFGLRYEADLPLQGLTVVDIGCGGGILAESMSMLGAKVLGIDVVAKNIAIARQHAKDTGKGVSYQLMTAESLAGSGEQFDVVLNMEVVEHVADLDGFVTASSQLVKPGGLMFVATINRTPLSWLIAIVGAEYILRWMPKGTHRWSMFRRPAELGNLLATNGLMVTDLVGVGVNPFLKKMYLTRMKSVNYMLTATHALDQRR